MGVSPETDYGLEGFGTSASKLFAAVMEQSPDHIYIKDTASRFIAISRAMARDFGLDSPKDAIGKTDFDIFTEEHARQAYEDEQEILRTGTPILNKVEKETWEDGHVTWVSSTKAPLFLGSGKIVGLIGISRDVTSEHEAQQALEANERKLKQRDVHIRRDLRSARHVQQVFIPGDIPKVPGLKLALRLLPMEEVGGDIITFPVGQRHGLLFFLGDVTGHGVTAALFTLLVKYLTDRQGEGYDGSPQHFLKQINGGLIGRIPDGFVAGLCGHLLPRPNGGATLLASNAGHPEFIHYQKATDRAELVKLPMGNVLGLPLEAGSPDTSYELEPGDRLLFFTDGIIEMPNSKGGEFGHNRTVAALANCSKLPLEEAADRLITEARAFSGGGKPKDDLSLLLIEIE